MFRAGWYLLFVSIGLSASVVSAEQVGDFGESSALEHVLAGISSEEEEVTQPYSCSIWQGEMLCSLGSYIVLDEYDIKLTMSQLGDVCEYKIALDITGSCGLEIKEELNRPCEAGCRELYAENGQRYDWCFGEINEADSYLIESSRVVANQIMHLNRPFMYIGKCGSHNAQLKATAADFFRRNYALYQEIMFKNHCANAVAGWLEKLAHLSKPFTAPIECEEGEEN